MNTKHFFFVRHGESRANATGIREGISSPLTERGKMQAGEVAKRMQKLGIQRIITSGHLRAEETAHICAEHIGIPTVLQSTLFGERRNPSIMIGKGDDDAGIIRVWEEIETNYGNPEWRHSDEENFEDLRSRVISGLHFLTEVPETHVMIASHGLFMKAILAHVILGDILNGRIFWDQFVPIKNISNTGIMHLEYTENYRGSAKIWKLVSWNDHAHLPPHLA